MFGIRKKYNMVIIGAGSIGAMKPDKFDSPKTKNVLTMAHAAYNNRRINLFIVDNDLEKLSAACKKWKCRGFQTLADFRGRADIIAVCTPTETHYEVIGEAISYFPKVIIAEKPFCSNITEAIEIHERCNNQNITLMVDYIRRYDSATEAIRKILNQASLFINNSIYHVIVNYNRGFIHEACHAVNLMHYWFGNCNSVELIPGREIIDRDENDPSVSLVCRHTAADVYYLPVDGRKVSMFEITIMTSRGKIILRDHGKIAEFQAVKDEETYGNYKSLDKNIIITETELPIALSNLVKTAVAAADGDHGLNFADGYEALAVHRVIKQYKLAKEFKNGTCN